MPAGPPPTGSDDRAIQRRRVLAASAAALAGIAGCSTLDAETPATAETASGSSTPDGAATATPDRPTESRAGRDEGTATPRDLRTALAAGDVVAVLRPPAGQEGLAASDLVDTDACGGERTLSSSGRADARAVGTAFAALDAPVEQVVATTHCPARETAWLAFGAHSVTDDLAEPLAQPPGEGAVRVVVAPGERLAGQLPEPLAAGACAVLSPGEDGPELVGSGDPRIRADGATPPPLRRSRYDIRAGTPEATSVFRRRSSTDGPRVLVLGGIHGDEVAGYRAVEAASTWSVEAGTLVLVPRASEQTIARDRRTDRAGRDLNRQFPLDGEPRTALARELYNVVVRYDPDLVLDMHSSQGVWNEGGFGQAVFHSGDPTLAATLERVVGEVNESVVPPSRQPDYRYEAVESDGSPPGMLATKVAEELGVPAALHEVTEEVPLETQVEWSTAVLARVLEARGVSLDTGE